MAATTTTAAAASSSSPESPLLSIVESLVAQCRVASPHHLVCKEECVYTFHSPSTTDDGIVVNLNSFIGTVVPLALNGSPDLSTGIFLRIVQHHVPKEKKSNDVKDEQPPATEQEPDATAAAIPTKLGIGIEGGFPSLAEEDAFDIVSNYSIVILERSTASDKDDNPVRIVSEWPYTDETKSNFPPALVSSVESILSHAGMAVQQDVQVWQLDQEPVPVSKYAESLPFVDNGITIDPNPSSWKCQSSGATENLWLNLSDGYIGGGRKHWDGSGGSNGALDHYNETGRLYPLVVKLGTITADINTADCYSYAPDEDGPVRVPNLIDLLEKRGIKVASLQKTVKSTVELEVELNATYAFDAITEAGSQLKPVSGPTLQGLQNLGNSCYMNSVVQLLLSGTVPELAHRYGFGSSENDPSNLWSHPLLQSVKPTDAALDILCQTTKLSSALTSGAFAVASDVTSFAHRLQPRMFKQAIGGQHVEFRTGQQQDAAQYLQFLLEQLDRAEQKTFSTSRWKHAAAVSNAESSSDQPPQLHTTSFLFSFQTTSRLVCSADQKIKYQTNPAPDTIWSLRVPMDQAVVKPSTLTSTEETESAAPEHKRPKKSDEEEQKVPTVTFQACVDAWAAESTVEGIRWAHLNQAVHAANSQTRFTTFPRYLMVQIQRYKLGPDWAPIKLEVNLDIPEEIDLSAYRSSGPQEGENLVPPEDNVDNNNSNNQAANEASANQSAAVNEDAVAQLMDMGFSRNGCIRALVTVGGDPEAAMNWILEHSFDDDFNDPLPESGGGSSNNNNNNKMDIDEGVVMSLVENLGCFTMDQVRAALKETNGAADRAADWLFSHMDDLDGAIAALESPADTSSSTPTLPKTPTLEDGDGTYSLVGMISHIGKHTGSGHYVAHLKRPDLGWVIFNDDKVAISESPPFHHAYMYLFQRKDTVGKPNLNY